MKAQPHAPVDFLIIAPLPEERDAILAKLDSRVLPPDNQDIRSYFAADLPIDYPDGVKSAYKIIVATPVGMERDVRGNE